MDSIGRVVGYAALFGEVSIDISPPKSKTAWREVIERGALSFAPNMTCNAHHFGPGAFAFLHDGSLEVGKDSTGLWFVAALPPTANGYDVYNGLAGGKSLGASIEFNSAEWRDDGHGVNAASRPRDRRRVVGERHGILRCAGRLCMARHAN